MNKQKIKNLVLIHGRGPSLWLGCVQDELAKQSINIKVVTPHLCGKSETYKAWKSKFERQKCGRFVNESTIFVAHSLGSQFAVKYLVELRKEIGGYISVAAPREIAAVMTNDDERRNHFKDLADKYGFGLDENDCAVFKNLKFPKISVYCDDFTDDTFDVKNMGKYADAIGARHVLVKNKGHFKDERMYPEILESIKNIIGVLGDE